MAAPAHCAPSAATIQPSPFGAQIATRSEGPTPAAIMARVAVPTSSPSSRYVTRRPGWTTASASGRDARVAATAAGIVSSCVSRTEAVDTRGVLAGHLAQDIGTVLRQRRLRHRLARVRPGAVAVRVVRRPHHVADADARDQLDAELLVLVRREALPREDLARQHADLVVLGLGAVLVRLVVEPLDHV